MATKPTDEYAYVREHNEKILNLVTDSIREKKDVVIRVKVVTWDATNTKTVGKEMRLYPPNRDEDTLIKLRDRARMAKRKFEEYEATRKAPRIVEVPQTFVTLPPPSTPVNYMEGWRIKDPYDSRCRMCDYCGETSIDYWTNRESNKPRTHLTGNTTIDICVKCADYYVLERKKDPPIPPPLK